MQEYILNHLKVGVGWGGVQGGVKRLGGSRGDLDSYAIQNSKSGHTVSIKH